MIARLAELKRHVFRSSPSGTSSKAERGIFPGRRWKRPKPTVFLDLKSDRSDGTCRLARPARIELPSGIRMEKSLANLKCGLDVADPHDPADISVAAACNWVGKLHGQWLPPGSTPVRVARKGYEESSFRQAGGQEREGGWKAGVLKGAKAVPPGQSMWQSFRRSMHDYAGWPTHRKRRGNWTLRMRSWFWKIAT